MTAIVLLTKNESAVIGDLIDNLKLILDQKPNLNAKLFLCDDSTDQTADIAKQNGLQILKGKNLGLGWSYYFALNSISERNLPLVDQEEMSLKSKEGFKPEKINSSKKKSNIFQNIITIDADGQTDLSELPIFYKELERGYDLVVGSRFLKKKSISYIYPRINFFGIKLLAFIITFCARQKFTDSHGGLRAMRSEVAKKLKFLGTYSYVQETIITAKEQGFKIKEMPSKWHKRKYGQSRVVHSKWKYIKAMSLPLLLRMKIHYLFLFLAFFLFVLSRYISSIWPILFFGLAELYKMSLFKKNLKEIREWTKNG